MDRDVVGEGKRRTKRIESEAASFLEWPVLSERNFQLVLELDLPSSTIYHSITPRIFPQWSQPLVANLSSLQHHLAMVDQDVSLAGYRKELKDAHALVVREFDRSKAQSKPDAIQRIADFCHNSEQEQSLRRVAVSGQ